MKFSALPLSYGFAASAHRAHQPVRCQFAPIGLRRLLVRRDRNGESDLVQMACVDCGAQCCQRLPRIDLTTQRISHHSPRPRVEDHCEVDEAACDGEVGNADNPELVRSDRNEAAREVGEDRAVM